MLLQWLATGLGSAPPRPFPSSLGSLLGSRFFLAKLLFEQLNAVYAAMFFLLLFLLLRVLVRGAWAALLAIIVIVGAVVVATPGAGLTGAPLIDVAIVGATLGTAAFLVVRFGLLVLAVMFLFATLEILPTWNLTAWYATSSRIGLALILLVTSYGFVTALAGRPLFRSGLLED